MNDRDGAGIDFEQSVFPLRARRLYLIPADVFFSCRSEEAFNHFYVHFDVLSLAGSLKKKLFSLPIELAPKAALEKEARALAKIAQVAGASTPDFAVQYRVQALIVSAFANYLQTVSIDHVKSFENLNADQSQVAPALEYIEKHLSGELNNAILARLCCLSQDHFARRFREIIGETPGQFICKRRVAVAAQELLFSTASIDEIAARAGFCNRFYFSRVFNAEMRMPPAAYRKMTRP